ncbi:MAG: hypothetical protein NXI12_07075 [Alphaproteobacteria bacterium]|nr:hypothetical protein [Alphaproteobacteria bacterium]
MLAVVLAAALGGATGDAECAVLTAVAEEFFGVRRSETRIVDEAGEQIGAYRNRYLVGETPHAFSLIGRVQEPLESDTGEALIELTDELNRLRRMSPVLRRHAARQALNLDLHHVEAELGALPQAMLADFVERNGLDAAWSCPLAQDIAYAATIPARDVELSLHHISISRPGFDADGRRAIVFISTARQAGAPEVLGRTNFSAGWMMLSRESDQQWRIVDRATVRTALGR